MGQEETSMKRIGLIGAMSALAMALLVPAAVSAHTPPPYGGGVDKALCTNRGGQHGFGKIRLQMSAWAYNYDAELATPNYIRIVGTMDQKINGVWVRGSATTATTQVYPDGTANDFTNMLGLGWHFRSADHPRTRMTMRIEFWDDRPTGDVRLANISARTAAC
jgi:hypothetical protein